MSETDFAIDPANPRIAKAGVVSFEVSNDGRAPHALEVEGPKGEVETDTIEPGKTAILEADLSEPGRYEWYCPVGDHREQGMEGEITVAGGGTSTQEDSGGGGTTEDDSGGGSYGY